MKGAWAYLGRSYVILSPAANNGYVRLLELLGQLSEDSSLARLDAFAVFFRHDDSLRLTAIQLGTAHERNKGSLLCFASCESPEAKLED